MARKVSLIAVNSELRLANNGVTIRVDSDDPQSSGRLRVGKAKIVWTPAIRGARIGGSRSITITWEKLIEFLKSQP